jgi:hypothetical protein
MAGIIKERGPAYKRFFCPQCIQHSFFDRVHITEHYYLPPLYLQLLHIAIATHHSISHNMVAQYLSAAVSLLALSAASPLYVLDMHCQIPAS